MYKEKKENEELKKKIAMLERQLYLDNDSFDESTSMATESFSLERMTTI